MVKKDIFYSIHRMAEPNNLCFSVGKLNDDLEVLETYYISPAPSGKHKYMCTCPSYKQPCKHIGYMNKFINEGKLNTGDLLHPFRGWVNLVEVSDE